MYEKVNVEGTQVILDSCKASSVSKLVFTSSGGVVYDGEENLVDVDERLAYPDVPLDAYNETKARAEKMVLEANGKDGLLTCAIRPAGIFGFVHPCPWPSFEERDLARLTRFSFVSFSDDAERATSSASRASCRSSRTTRPSFSSGTT